MTITWTQAITGAFALITAVAAAIWAVTSAHISDLESRLDAAEKANSLGYPNLVEQINNASVILKARLTELQSIDNLTAEVASLKTEKATLLEQLKKEQAQHQNALEKMRQDLHSQLEQEKETFEHKSHELVEQLRVINLKEEKLRKEIETVYSENQLVALKAGEGANFAGGSATVGFSSASMENVCSASVNGQHKNMEAGDYVEVKSLDRQCKIILELCRYDHPSTASFRFVCTK